MRIVAELARRLWWVALISLVVFANGCAEKGPAIGMTRQQVLQSSTAGLPKQQEVAATGKTDVYDWGSVRYDDQERVVEVVRVKPRDPVMTLSGIQSGILANVQRIAVLDPTVDIYRITLIGADEHLGVDVTSLQRQLTDLMVRRLASFFGPVSAAGATASLTSAGPALLQAQTAFAAAVRQEGFPRAIQDPAPAAIVGPLTQVAPQLGVDAVLTSFVKATVQEASSAANSPADADVFACASFAAADRTCGMAPPPPPLMYPFIWTSPLDFGTKLPPVVVSMSVAIVGVDAGEILWSHVGALRGSLRTAADLTPDRLQQLVDAALPDPRLEQS